MLVKYSPCTRARHGVGHDIGQAWRFESVSCPFSSAHPFYRTFYRISIPAGGGRFAALLAATCARLETRRPGHRRNNACGPSTTLAPLALGRVSRFTSAPLRRRGVGCRRYARLRSATLHCALLRAGSQHRKDRFNGNRQVNCKKTLQCRPATAIHLRYRDSRPDANRKSFAPNPLEAHRNSQSPT